MSRTKAKELNNRRDGTEQQRATCATCHPVVPGRIRCDQLWEWSKVHPGENPFRVEGQPSR